MLFADVKGDWQSLVMSKEDPIEWPPRADSRRYTVGLSLFADYYVPPRFLGDGILV